MVVAFSDIFTESFVNIGAHKKELTTASMFLCTISCVFSCQWRCRTELQAERWGIERIHKRWSGAAQSRSHHTAVLCKKRNKELYEQICLSVLNPLGEFQSKLDTERTKSSLSSKIHVQSACLCNCLAFPLLSYAWEGGKLPPAFQRTSEASLLAL